MVKTREIELKLNKILHFAKNREKYFRADNPELQKPEIEMSKSILKKIKKIYQKS